MVAHAYFISVEYKCLENYCHNPGGVGFTVVVVEKLSVDKTLTLLFRHIYLYLLFEFGCCQQTTLSSDNSCSHDSILSHKRLIVKMVLLLHAHFTDSTCLWVWAGSYLILRVLPDIGISIFHKHFLVHLLWSAKELLLCYWRLRLVPRPHVKY